VFRTAPVVVAARERQILPSSSRIALVMGVGAYARAQPLTNPKNDAAAIAERLTRLGFGVTLLTDETQSELLRAIEQFGDSLARAEVGFIYFAGHGVQIEGENYLLPKDVEVDGPLKLQGSAMALGTILDVITRSQKAGIVFLDCCRNNPFGGKAGSRSLRSDYRGLAKIDAPRGTFIAFSTAPGLTASDGLEGVQNSPFTASVLKHIETADLRISDLMLTVRQEVYAATGGQQLPWENSSLLLPFSFNQKKEDLGGPEDLAKANREREDAHWHLAEQSQNPELLRSFVSLYPYSRYRALADRLLNSLTRKRVVRYVGAAAALLLLAVVGAAWIQLELAERDFKDKRLNDARQTQSKYLAKFSLQQTDIGDPGTGLLLALEGLPDPDSDNPELQKWPKVEAATLSLMRALTALNERMVLSGHESTVHSVAVTSDNTRAVTGSADATARVWNLKTGVLERVLEGGHKDLVSSVAVTTSTGLAVTGSWDGIARVFDLKTGAKLRELTGHTSDINGVAVSPDGNRVVTTSQDQTARIWDINTGAELFQLRGHTGFVQSVAVTKDGVVTGSSDTTVRIWDLNTGSEVKVLKGHLGTVHSVAVTPDGNRLLTGSWDNTARLWDLKTGNVIRVLSGHAGPIYAVATDGARGVTASQDGTTRVWDLKTGTEVARLRGHQARVSKQVSPTGAEASSGPVRSVAMTSDGKLLITGGEDRTTRVWDLSRWGVLKAHKGRVTSVAIAPSGSHFVTGSDDKTAQVWDLRTGIGVTTLEGHQAPINSVVVTPDGTRVVTGSGASRRDQLPSGVLPGPGGRGFARDYTARLWDLKTGTKLKEFQGHNGAINSVAVTPDGKLLVTGSDDKTVRVWDMATGEKVTVVQGLGEVDSVLMTADGTRVITAASDGKVRLWDAKSGAMLSEFKAHETDVRAVALIPGRDRIVTGGGDGTAFVWDLSTRTALGELKGHDSAIFSVAVTQDGRRAITGSADNTARVWNLETGMSERVLAGHKGYVYGVAVTPDATRAVTASWDGTARVWNLQTGAMLLEFKGHKSDINGVTVAPDGRRVVTASDDRTARVWDIDTGTEILELKEHTDFVYGVAVTPDGNRLVTGSRDKTARIWDLRTGKRLETLRGHQGAVHSVWIAPDGNRLVTGSWDTTAKVWDLATGYLHTVLRGAESHSLPIRSVAVTPDGKGFITGSDDATARLWDLRTGRHLAVFQGHKAGINSVAVTPDGRQLVTGSDDRSARLWDLTTRAMIAEIKGEHTGSVTSTALLPGGKRLVTVSSDGTARVWDLNANKEIAVLQGHQGPVNSIAAIPEGVRIVTGSDDGTIRLWEAEAVSEGSDLVKQAKNAAPRCLTLEQRDLFNLKRAPTWCDAKWPNDAASLIAEAGEDLRQRRFGRAIDSLQRARARTLDDRSRERVHQLLASAYNSGAWDLFLNKKFAEGLPLAEEAMKLAPGNFHILDTRGQIYFGLNRVEEACADLEEAIKRGLRAPGTYYGRGVCNERKGKTDLAIADYRRVLAEPASAKYDTDAHKLAQERLTALGADKGAGGKQTP
jgi:WD40 repeat protein